MMRRTRIECPVCSRRKNEELFDHDLGICLQCAERAHKAALEYSARQERDKNAPVIERKELVDGLEEHRDAERDIKPPRVYPYPWGPKK